jgi:hypothetical protein
MVAAARRHVHVTLALWPFFKMRRLVRRFRARRLES